MPSPITPTRPKRVLAITAVAAVAIAGLVAIPQSAQAAAGEFGSVAGQSQAECFFNSLGPNDDDRAGPITLVHPLSYQGETYDTAFVSNNGYIGLYSTTGDYAEIDVYANDVDTRPSNGGSVTWGQSDDGTFCAVWNRVGYFSYGTDRLNTYQAIISPAAPSRTRNPGDFVVTFNFDSIQKESDPYDSSGGIPVGWSFPASAYAVPASQSSGEGTDTGADPLIAGSANSTQVGRYVYTFDNEPTVEPGVPTITSTGLTTGSVATAAADNVNPADATLTYQWNRDGVAIPDATDADYTLTDDDVDGHVLTVTVTGAADGYNDGTATSADFLLEGNFPDTTPTITGDPTLGSTLTADADVTPSDADLSYQWSRNGDPISGADQSTHTVTSDDIATELTVRVTASKTNFADASFTSDATIVPGTLTTDVPTISSTGTTVGSTLTADAGSWTPSNTAFSYQWNRDGDPIADATDSDYTLTSDDIDGHTITVTVTGTKRDWTTASETSADFVLNYLFSDTTATITGDLTVGSTLTATAAFDPAATTVTYQWLRDGDPIADADQSTYVLTADDLLSTISVVATGSSSGFDDATVTSAGRHVPGVLTVGTASVSGTTGLGDTLTAVAANWGPTPVAFTYQWTRDGSIIAHETGATYVVTAADQGHSLAVVVTAAKTDYTGASLTSSALVIPAAVVVAPTPVVTPVVPAPAVVPAAVMKTLKKDLSVAPRGKSKVGARLTANTTTWTVQRAVKLTYRWFANGTSIKGATHSTLKVTKKLLHKKITVRVTAKKDGYAKVSVVSAATPRIAK